MVNSKRSASADAIPYGLCAVVFFQRALRAPHSSLVLSAFFVCLSDKFSNG